MSQIVSSLAQILISNKNIFFGLKLSLTAYGYIFRHISLEISAVVLVLILLLRFFLGLPDSDLVLTFFEKFGRSVYSLKGNVIWITGASSGIGEAIAYELAKGKVKLALSARSEDKLQNVKKRCMEIGSLNADDILVVPFDMTTYDKHEWAFSTVLKHFGKLDVLVSNAGRAQMAYWQTIDVAVDKALFDLNVFSLLNLARIVTKHFLSVGGGRHVVMSSVAGVMGNPLSASYSASKHAINGYFEALRFEKGNKGISINVLCPGPVDTNIMEALVYDKLDKKEKAVTRTIKLMSSERCAQLCVIAMANNIKEAWILNTPILIYIYMFQYFPTFMKWLCHNVDMSMSYKQAN